MKDAINTTEKRVRWNMKDRAINTTEKRVRMKIVR